MSDKSHPDYLNTIDSIPARAALCRRSPSRGTANGASPPDEIADECPRSCSAAGVLARLVNAAGEDACRHMCDFEISIYLKRTHFDGPSTCPRFQLKLVELSTSHIVNAQGVPVQTLSGRFER